MTKKIISTVLWLLSKMPFWFLYFISDILFVLIYYIIGYRKKVVFKNLRLSFPDKNQVEIKKIAKDFYKYFPDIIVETIKMYSISEKEVRRRMELVDPEVVYNHINQGKSIVGVTSHYANWELGIHGLSLMIDNPKLIIYKPLNNKDFNSIFNHIRTRFGATMVPMKQILRHVVKLKDTPHISVFVADQTPVYQDSDYYIEFLNQDTLVYTGPERIAKMTNNPVVYCEIRRKAKRGYYYCKFTTLAEVPNELNEYEVTLMYNRFSERIIREEPQYWLWSHNRWKRQRRDK